MNKNVITGSMVAIITPFKNGKVDEELLDKIREKFEHA